MESVRERTKERDRNRDREWERNTERKRENEIKDRDWKKSESVRDRKVIENFNKTQTSKESQKKQQKMKGNSNCISTVHSIQQLNFPKVKFIFTLAIYAAHLLQHQSTNPKSSANDDKKNLRASFFLFE